MHVAIIGTGNVGQALAKALRPAGHTIIFGLTPDAAAQETSIADAAARADVSILAVPFGALADVVAAAGGFAGKIVVDATNPLGMRDGSLGLTMGFDTSGAEQLASLAPQAMVFKAFNQTGWENMADAGRYSVSPVMFVAGDDATAKPKVLSLVADAGFEAIDLGPLRTSRLLEPWAMLWIELARKRGLGPDFAFTLQKV